MNTLCDWPTVLTLLMHVAKLDCLRVVDLHPLSVEDCLAQEKSRGGQQKRSIVRA